MLRVLWVLLLLLWGVFLPQSVRGEAPQSLFETYSTLNGLTHNRISDIYTDSEGFVWICTWYGVSRFDGYAFKNFSTRPGDFSPLTHNRFLQVSEDSSTHLWFLTYNHHVYRFNRFTEEFEDPMTLLEGVDAKHYRASQILHDGCGRSWVVIPTEGVVCFAGGKDATPLRVEQWWKERALQGEITASMLDRENNLYLATEAGELYRITATGDRPQLMGRSEAPVVQCTTLDQEHYFLSDKGLYRLKQGATHWEQVAQGEGFTAMQVDTLAGRLYVGDRRGALRSLTPGTGELTLLCPTGDRLQRIRSLYCDSHGLLWITTPEAGITRYDPDRGDCKHFEQRPYTVAYNIDTLTRLVESKDRLWVKMNKYGFGYYNREEDRMESFYNDPSKPDCLMTNAVVRFDVQGDVLWLTTYFERGLRRALIQKHPAELHQIETDRAGDMPSEVRAMITDSRGGLWLGTKSGELFRYNSDWSQRRSYAGPENRHWGMIYALKEDHCGNIWVGTRGQGLHRLRPEGDDYRLVASYRHDDEELFSLSNDHIYSIEEDDEHRLWIATYGGGLNLFDPEGDRFIHAENLLAHYPLGEFDRVRWLLNDGRGRMLAATVDGLLLFDPMGDPKNIHFQLAQKQPGDHSSLGNNDIIHMLRDSRQRVWLATYGGGLNRIEGYNAEGFPLFKGYGVEQGLQSNICLSVVEDSMGHIWVTTQSSVSCLDEHTDCFTTYPFYEGLANIPFNETGGLATPQGPVLFSRGDRIYSFQPSDAHADPVDYQLTFTGFTIKNEAAGIGEGLPLEASITKASRVVLPHNYSNFRIDFASLNFASQRMISYMYKLEGYDKDWIQAGRLNSASYSNVPTGRYTFRVKGYMGNISAAGGEITLEVVVRPPWWFSWWAKGLYLVALAGFVALAWRFIGSMQRIRREARVEQEMTDLKLKFFTNISHELRTPLTLILGGIEEVRKHDSLTQRGAISLNLAHKNARRMLALINQLLDFRKIVKEKMELKISRVNLVQLAEDALEDFREMAAERHIELLFTVSRRSILVWVDLERIESVVYNLLSNAFKFTRNGGRIEMILTLSEREEMALMTVRDNGIGIPKEQQHSIFERFHQASRSVAGDMKGSGIGLSFCREIVQLHHGEIAVESRVGEGSAFTVKLRIGNGHFGMEQINFGEEKGEKSSKYMVSDYVSAENQRRSDISPPQDSPSILLVEDNRELRLFMYNSLIEEYHISEADDGKEALSVIAQKAPDIIITDLMMPNMDGIELINHIRKDFAISHIPIIMLTAKHSPDDRIKAMTYGADAYITKPFSIDLLQARIENLLTQRRTLFARFSSSAAENKGVKIAPEDVIVTDKDEAFMKSVMAWLAENVEKSDLTIDQLATHLGLGRTTMYNKLKGLTGKSPVELIKEYRITKSELLLRTGQFSVSEVAYKVGFSDPGYFSRCFRDQYRCSPAEYIKRLKNEENT